MNKKKFFLGMKHSLCGLFMATLSFSLLPVKADATRVTGIYNVGNSCFINSAIQALHSNNTFVHFVSTIATEFVKNENEDKVSVKLVKLFDCLDKEDEILQGKDENQKNLIKKFMTEISSGFYNGNHGSAVDVMNKIIEKVKEEAKEIINSRKELSHFLKFIDGFTEFSSGEKEGVPEAFNESVFKSLTQEPVPGQIGIITTDIKPSECLEKLFKERFNFEDVGLCYNLKSIICHKGSEKSGHFTTFVFGKVKNEQSEKWFFIDDNKINEIGDCGSILNKITSESLQPSCFIYEVENSYLSGINEFEYML